MRLILKLIAIMAVVWSAGWFIAAAATETGLSRWMEARRAEGWQAEARIVTDGFPFRLALRLIDLSLADPDTGLAWTAPRVDMVTRASNVTAFEVTWPPTQTFASPTERIDIRSGTMTGRVDIVPTGLVLESSDIALADLTLTSSLGWTATLSAGRFASLRQEADPLAHAITFTADEIGLPDPARDVLDPVRLLPDRIAGLALEARVAFDRPWDRQAIEDRRPQITRIDLSLASGRWGQMAFEATGDLDVDADGVPEGRLDVRATNWREMLRAAVAAGVVPPDMEDSVETGLEILAALSGNQRTIDASLTIARGTVFIGPVPLGPAPRLTIR